MKAKITIKFLKVNGKKVDESMTSSKRFIKVTGKTVDELCRQIKNYFNDYNINVSTENEIEV
jgi:hypothetical protein